MNKDYFGSNLQDPCVKLQSATECQRLCQQTEICAKFSYVTDTYNGRLGVADVGDRKRCCLKPNISIPLRVELGITSGPRFCSGLYIYDTVTTKCVGMRATPIQLI